MTWFVAWALLMNTDRQIGTTVFDHVFLTKKECREFVIHNFDNLDFGSHEVIYVGCKEKGGNNE